MPYFNAFKKNLELELKLIKFKFRICKFVTIFVTGTSICQVPEKDCYLYTLTQNRTVISFAH